MDCGWLAPFAISTCSFRLHQCRLIEVSVVDTYPLSWVSPKLAFKWAASWQNKQCGCTPSEDSDQPEHPPSLIKVFAVRMKKAWVLSYPLSAQQRLWSDWAYAQADLSLRWAHTHFLGFVTRRLINVAKAMETESRCLLWSIFNLR